MNIEKRLEAEHSKALTDAIVRYIGSNKTRLNELMDVFFDGDYRLTQRAAWAVGLVFEGQPDLLKGYYPKLIRMLKQPGHHPAITRNILRVLQTADIPEKYRAEILDICLPLIKSEAQPGAIRAFAISTAANFCSHYPELRHELELVFKELMLVPQSPAVRVRVRDACKRLAKSRGPE